MIYKGNGDPQAPSMTITGETIGLQNAKEFLHVKLNPVGSQDLNDKKKTHPKHIKIQIKSKHQAAKEHVLSREMRFGVKLSTLERFTQLLKHMTTDFLRWIRFRFTDTVNGQSWFLVGNCIQLSPCFGVGSCGLSGGSSKLQNAQTEDHQKLHFKLKSSGDKYPQKQN